MNRLPSDLIKLPWQFDSERLVYEIAQIPQSEWTRNPSKLAGNSALILVSVDGEINDKFAIAGPMKATKHLGACPYMQQVFATLDAPISRSRLMRLAPGAPVGTHLDARYHWFRRIRIHIPVITNPAVKFTCNEQTVHMAAGEAWTFNSAKPHGVVNPSDQERIHLVIDTKGSEALNEVIQNAAHLSPRFVPYVPDQQVEVPLEPYFFEVLTPQEIDSLLDSISQYVQGELSAEQWAYLTDKADIFKQKWRTVFAQYGHHEAGKSAYEQLIAWFRSEIKAQVDHLIPKHAMSRFYLAVIDGMLTISNRV